MCAEQEGVAPVLAAEQLDGLHWHETEGVVIVREIEMTRISLDDLQREIAHTLTQRREQLAVQVQRRDAMAGAGEVERDATAPCSDVEDPRRGVFLAGAFGELAP